MDTNTSLSSSPHAVSLDPGFAAKLEVTLANPAFLDGLYLQARDAAFYGDVAEAAKWVSDLKASLSLLPEFALRHTEERQKLTRTLALFQWSALSALKGEEEVSALFERHFTAALEVDGFNVWERVRTWLLTYPVLTERDRVKRLLREAFERNREPWGEGIGLGGSASAADLQTVGAWLKYALSQLGRKLFSAFEINSFLTRDANVRRLSPLAQEQLRTMLELYGRLQRSSLTVGGLEEELPLDEEEAKGIIREGRFEEITPAEEARVKQELDEMKKLIASTHSDVLLEKYEQWVKTPLVEKTTALLAQTPVKAPPGAAGKWLEEWFDAVNKKDEERVMRGLWQLARTGKIREAFGDSERYRGYWARHISLPGTEAGKTQAQLREEFLKDPAAPLFLLGFLRHVLEERLKMKEEDAKLVVLTMSNECRKAGEEEYSRLAYGDLNTGEFVWGG